MPQSSTMAGSYQATLPTRPGCPAEPHIEDKPSNCEAAKKRANPAGPQDHGIDAKKLVAASRISIVRSSPAFFRFNSRISRADSDVTPSALPASIWACRTLRGQIPEPPLA
jgi:hypothetical protein